MDRDEKCILAYEAVENTGALRGRIPVVHAFSSVLDTIHHGYQFMRTICISRASRAVFRIGSEVFSQTTGSTILGGDFALWGQGVLLCVLNPLEKLPASATGFLNDRVVGNDSLKFFLDPSAAVEN